MQTTSIQSSLLPRPFLGSFVPLGKPRVGRERASISILAMRGDGKREKRDYKLVDENMIVLKMRIQEMETKERENAAKPLERGKELWYKNYDSDVYEVVGLLQMLMMNNRPSLVLGVISLLVFSLSTSLVVVLSYLLGLLM